MRIHMRDIVRMPPAEVDGMFAVPEAQAQFARFADAQIADDEAVEALGVGIDRYAALDLPTLLVEGDDDRPLAANESEIIRRSHQSNVRAAAPPYKRPRSQQGVAFSCVDV